MMIIEENTSDDLELNIEDESPKPADAPTTAPKPKAAAKPAEAPKPKAAESNEELLKQIEALKNQNKELTDSKEESLSASDISDLISKQVQEALSNAKTETQDELLSETNQMMKRADDDLLDKAIQYFTHTSRACDFGYTRNGHEILPPNGPVKFKQWVRYSKDNGRSGVKGRGIETVSISKFQTRSKQEAEYLNKHPKFGVSFFLSPKDASSVERHLVDIMQTYARSIQGMTDLNVVARCKENDINVTEDIGTMRKDLIQKLAQDEMRKEDIKREKTVKRYASSEPEESTVLSTEGGAMLN